MSFCWTWSSWLFILELIQVQYLTTVADYRLEVTAHLYSNPDGVTSAGDCCDYRFSWENRPPNCGIRQDYCDTGFTFCLRSLGTPHDGNPINCLLGRYETRQYVGENYITFDRPFIESPNVPNPLVFTGTSWMGGVQFYVEAEDRDPANDQLIDDIYADVILTPGHSLHQRSYPGSFDRASISLTFNLTCTGAHQGPNCTNTDRCEQLFNPVNGQVQQPTTIVEGSIAVYTCNSGYILNGANTRTCRSGQWTNNAPTCAPMNIIDCGPPSRPTNGGTSFTSTTFQSQATYTCANGYYLQGPTTRWCQSDGTWSGHDPQCTRVNIHCAHNLEDPLNGRVSVNGGVATYTCDYGYMLSGSSVQTCLETGQWSSTAPTCKIIDCGSPRRPQNGGTEFTSTTFQSQVTYTCASGYYLQGLSIRTCQSDGTWSGHEPVCSLKAGEPSKPVTAVDNQANGGGGGGSASNVLLIAIVVTCTCILLLIIGVTSAFAIVSIIVLYTRKVFNKEISRVTDSSGSRQVYNVQDSNT